MILVFLIFSLRLNIHSPPSPSSRGSSLSAIRVVSSAYLRLLMLLPPILIPAFNSSHLAFLMLCSAFRLNKQGNSRQPCWTPFSILNQSVVPYRVLTVASWPMYRFLRSQIRWSGILVFSFAYIYIYVCIHIYIHTIFHVLFHYDLYKILNIVSMTLLFICFIYSNLYLLIPNS